MISRTLAAVPAGADEEQVEFLAGYLDPHASWEAILVESARVFPGAAARLRDVCGELAAALDEMDARQLFLAGAGFVVEDIQGSLREVRERMGPVAEPSLSRALTDLDRAVDRLGLLVAAGELTIRERQALGRALWGHDPEPR